MKQLNQNQNSITITVLFLFCYFYLDQTLKTNKLILFLTIGVYIALCAFILFGKLSTATKILFLSILSGLLLIAPLILNKGYDTKRLDNRFLGIWKSDSSEGYSITINIKNDSAYLSQSTINLVKAFEVNIYGDTFILNSPTKILRFKYTFLNNDETLKLLNQKDSLILSQEE